MRYTLLLQYPEMSTEELGAEALAEGMRAFDEYAKALDAAGVLVSAEVLEPSSATTTISLPAVSWSCRTARSPTPRNSSAARS